ncbi:MAG: hypothetical protein K5694_00730 [Bacilli bacterium]|nr:hypothetical protein [Bacilli bacterium]
MKTYCGDCKKALDQGDRFCRYCGSSRIIIEKDEEAPSFEINGDTLETYNSGYSHAFKDIRLYLFHCLDHTLEKSEFFDTMKKIERDDLSSWKRELSDTWKQMTALVIPQSVKRIDIERKFSDFSIFYSISIHPDVHFFNFWPSHQTYIGYINIPPKTEIKKVGQIIAYELKIDEGRTVYDIGNYYDTLVNRIVLPKTLKQLLCKEPHYMQINSTCEINIPSSVDYIDIEMFSCWSIGKVFYDGTKYKFKSILHFTELPFNSFDLQEFTPNVVIHCTDGDLRLRIIRKEDKMKKIEPLNKSNSIVEFY